MQVAVKWPGLRGWCWTVFGLLLSVLSPCLLAQPGATTPSLPAGQAESVSAEQIVELERLREQGQANQALPLALAAWEQAQRQPPRPPALTETLLMLIGRLHSDLNAPDAAEPFFSAALEAAEKRLGMNALRLDASLYFRAGNLVARGQLAAAEPHYLRLLALYQTHRGEQHVDLVEPLRALARLRRLQGRASEAERLIQRTLALWQSPSATVFGVRFDGSDHDWQNLAALRFDAGQFDQAEALYQKALVKIEADLKEGQERFGMPGNGVLARQADCLERLARVAARQGREAEADRRRTAAAAARAQIRSEPLSRPSLWGLAVFAIGP